MIQMGTRLVVADNSGAKRALCIRPLRSKRIAGLGDVIVVSVRKALPNSKVKEGGVYKAVIVRTKVPVKRSGGQLVSFGDNAIVLLNNAREMIGRRVFGAVGREVRTAGFAKVGSLAREVI